MGFLCGPYGSSLVGWRHLSFIAADGEEAGMGLRVELIHSSELCLPLWQSRENDPEHHIGQARALVLFGDSHAA